MPALPPGRSMVPQAGWDSLKRFTFQSSIMRTNHFLFVLTALIGFNTVKAQNKSNDTTARYFIIQASIGNLQEIAMGRIAVQQAVSPEVKAFAQRMIADHSKAETQLMQLVRSRGFQIPREATDPPGEDMMLKNTPAKDFDRVYVHMMLPGHRETVQLFEKYALTGKDPDVNAFAKQTLPVLKEHLASITAINNNMRDTAAK
jgi:putative membrane protein